ncbi:MAG: extensin family protein [Rhizobiaceae bacterium]|nr:extensin family protein [Rhizobiaceae bacterium]
MKKLSNLRLALPAAAISLAAAAFAYAAVEELPKEGPVPPAKPAVGELLAAVPNTPKPRPDFVEPEQDIDPMPAEERACRGNLIALGVEFEELEEIDGEGECGIAFPVKVTSLGSDVELSPDAVVNCATAETAARLVQETARPAAKRELGAEIVGIRHASAYVCRHRWNGEKISEHARGNALDIAAFLLEDGRTVDVQAYGPADMPERRFMATVRRHACGPFKTVLGPGTDADHALHFHFDLAERRRGSTYCR